MGSGGKTIAEGQSPGNGVRSRGGAGTPARQQQGEVRAPDDPVAIEVDAGLRTPPGGEQEGEVTPAHGPVRIEVPEAGAPGCARARPGLTTKYNYFDTNLNN